MAALAWRIGRKVAALFLTLAIASFLIYGLVAITPGDPAALLAGGNVPNPERAAAIRAEYRLDDPFLLQYWNWLSSALQGDLGQSYFFRADVATLIGERAVSTVLLVVYSAVLLLVVGIGLGIWAGLRGTKVNSFVTTITTMGMALPSFVVAIILIWLFSTQLGWFPVYGSGEGLLDRLWHLTLPAVALAVIYVAYITRITRTAIFSELSSEHVDTARVRGIPGPIIVRRHVLLNASASILTVSGLMIAGLFAGTAIVEQAFTVNGIGSLLVQAARQQDLPVVMGVSLLIVTGFVTINMVVDVINAVLDPRTQNGARL
ncbi:ABC transporter permease [Microbacterium sp. PMB16]|uniref:ABC transporter permease n=1 Tax=Microbacterium sp. PMB16 TaxID=3120157 RepID=UPI003F4C5858